jgi:hypothetical protein
VSRHGKRDILIHFDEEQGELIFYTASVDDTNNIREKEFDGARIDIPFLSEKSADEAEKLLGGMVFSLVDTFSFKKIGIRHYEALNEESHRQHVAEWEAAAKNGDAEAQFMLFIEYHSRALFNCDAESLKKAEAMLEAAVAQGYESAIERKEHWPLMRSAVERKLKRGPVA